MNPALRIKHHEFISHRSDVTRMPMIRHIQRIRGNRVKIGIVDAVALADMLRRIPAIFQRQHDVMVRGLRYRDGFLCFRFLDKNLRRRQVDVLATPARHINVMCPFPHRRETGTTEKHQGAAILSFGRFNAVHIRARVFIANRGRKYFVRNSTDAKQANRY